MAKANPEQQKQEDKTIHLQRQHQVGVRAVLNIGIVMFLQMDASIVRIMKTRKTLSHANLVAEVIQQLQAR